MSNILTLNRRLKALNKKTPSNVKMEAALRFGCHLETVERYMRGNAKKEVLAKNLYEFFTNQKTTA